MKILLCEPAIGPHDITAGVVVLNEPLGLEAIAAGVLPDHDVRIADLRIESDLQTHLEEFKPDVVGVTSYTPSVYAASRILEEAKRFCPNSLTVAGGHHPTMRPEDFARPYVDAVVLGEGEVTFKELVEAHERGQDLASVPGLALPVDGTVRCSETRPLLRDLDDTPFPARHLTARHRAHYFRGSWRPLASLVTSRGCPFRCSFCAMWKIMRGKYRKRRPEAVADELARLDEDFIDIVDDNTLHDVKHAARLAEAIGARGLEKSYKLYARADTVVKHPELIRQWGEVGMRMILVGFESFRDDDLDRYHKRTSVKTNEEAIRILHEAGVEIAAYFLIEPDFTAEDFRALGDYVARMELTHPIFTVLTPFPGTDLYEERYEELTTHNYELFDFFHSVFPTRLPLKDFHRCLADLWMRFYAPKEGAGGGSPIIPPSMAEPLYRKLADAYRDYEEEAPEGYGTCPRAVSS